MKRTRDFSAYHIKRGRDGKVGIYLRAYNVRLATFNAGTRALQEQLRKLFDQHPSKP